MKLSEANAKLLETIRQATASDDEFSAGDLTARCAGLRAKENKELAAALRGLSAKSVGHWLKRHQGAIHGGWRLCADLGRRPKVWLYRFESMVELGAEGAADLDALECEARIGEARPGSIQYVAECERQIDRYLATEPKPLTITRADSFGRLKIEVVHDARTGEPVMEKAADAPMPQPEPAAIPGDKRPPWLQRGEFVPRDKAEWLAHQEYRLTGRRPGDEPGLWVEGSSNTPFYDPGGVVSHSETHDRGPRTVSTVWNGSLKDL